MNHLFLLDASGSTASSYGPVVLQALIVIGFVAAIAILSHFLGPRRRTHEKLINFESGIPGVGNARQPMAVKYFLVAILFVLFDVEVIFFYPYAVNFRELGTKGFYEVLLFVGFFVCGFIYIIKKGALEWDEG